MSFEPDITIVQIEPHRNGFQGLAFTAVLFQHAETPTSPAELFLATVFDEPGAIAIVCLDRIPRVGVHTSADGDGNAWRAEYFEAAIRGAILELGTYPKTRTLLDRLNEKIYRRDRDGDLLREARDELLRLQRGDFTEEEFQNLCHHFSEDDRARFEAGCKAYQAKLFGCPETPRNVAAGPEPDDN